METERTTYEYKVLSSPSERVLNELGAQGFRVVAAVPYYFGAGINKDKYTTVYMERVSHTPSTLRTPPIGDNFAPLPDMPSFYR